MNLFSGTLAAVIVLNLGAIGWYWFFVCYPFRRVRAKLEKLEHAEEVVRESRHHGASATRQAGEDVARLIRKRRLKWKQKARLERAYLLVLFPVSAGAAAIAFVINELLFK